MQTIYEGKDPKEKLEMLRANCDSVEKANVKVYFSEDDKYEMKSRLSESSIERDTLEDELKEMSAGIRRKIKTETGKIKGLLRFLKDGYEEQNQEVFNFADQENGLMLTYSSQGDLINSRKLRPAERQTSIVNFKEKTA